MDHQQSLSYEMIFTEMICGKSSKKITFEEFCTVLAKIAMLKSSDLKTDDPVECLMKFINDNLLNEKVEFSTTERLESALSCNTFTS